MSTKNTVLKYCRAVSSWLPCSRKVKADLLNSIRMNVGNYMEANPLASYDDIVACFGTPQQIAAACVAEMGTAELIKHLHVRRRIFLIFIITCVVFLLLWFSAAGILIYLESLAGEAEQLFI